MPKPPTKRCAACRETKPVTEFYRNARGMPGYRPYCKPCHKAKRQATYTNDEPYRQLLKREYGITLEEYNDLLRRQAHRCAACRRPETVRTKKTGAVRRLAVDHDHVTGTVRGLLCNRCNILVWAVEENHGILDVIGRYMDDFRATFAATPTS